MSDRLRKMKLTAYKTAVFKEKQDLPTFMKGYLPTLKEGDIVAVCSKLVCLWKGCTVKYKNRKQKEELIVKHSEAALKTKLAWLTVKAGMIMTNGGVDESNANGKLLYFPPDMFACADELCGALKKQFHLKKLGIIITDSMILPLRAGVVAAAVGYSGFGGVRDERGKKDIFGKPLQTTLVNVADSLATAAALTMGERNEQTPLCVIEKAPVRFVRKTNRAEISYPPQQDLYAPLLKAVKLTKTRRKK